MFVMTTKSPTKGSETQVTAAGARNCEEKTISPACEQTAATGASCSPKELTWTHVQAIQHSAEAQCPGVTQRVTTADFSAIVNAVVTTMGGPFPFRPRLSPPAALLADVARALGDAVNTADRRSTRSVSVPLELGSRRKSAAASKLRGQVRATKPKDATNSKVAPPGSVEGRGARVSSKPVDSGAEDTSPKRTVDRRQKVLSKALRSLGSDNTAGRLARGACGVTRKSLIDRVTGFSDSEFADVLKRIESGIPAIAACGAFDSLCSVAGVPKSGASWANTSDFSEWSEAALARYNRAKGRAVNGPTKIIELRDAQIASTSLADLRSTLRTAVLSRLSAGFESKDWLSLHGLQDSDMSLYLDEASSWLITRRGFNCYTLHVKGTTAGSPVTLKSYLGFKTGSEQGTTTIWWSASLSDVLAVGDLLRLPVTAPPSVKEVGTEASSPSGVDPPTAAGTTKSCPAQGRGVAHARGAVRSVSSVAPRGRGVAKPHRGK